MIYKFSLKDDNGKDKIFYLTADNTTKLYRRIISTYQVMRDDITLLAEYTETKDYKYKLKKSYEKKSSKKEEKEDEKIISKAKEIFSKSRKLSGEGKSKYKEKMNFSEVVVEKEEDLYPLLKKYKKVKVYFETGEKRGTKKFYALVR